jgi:hypothetical protein
MHGRLHAEKQLARSVSARMPPMAHVKRHSARHDVQHCGRAGEMTLTRSNAHCLNS